jgi:hypothetical protein
MKELVKAVKSVCSHVTKTKLTLITQPSLSQDLVKFEEKMIGRQLKIGVLLRKGDQKTEEEMFQNENSTVLLEDFLKCIATRVALKGFKGFKGLNYNVDTN